ncbi:MAG: response regulator, partial [Hyphomicrobiales bacterium]|nr:response regulator [Hyphomicrobiales bacterium]
MTNRILIVDDEPKNLDVLHTCLREAGFKVLIAESGEAALQRIAYTTPDIILLDINMPGINGYETCRRLKDNEVSKDTPIIFVTAETETVDKVRGLEMGAVDYITKPFQPEEVVARVERHLTIRNLQKQIDEQNVQLQQEIAERKRAEKLLRESEEKYKALFNNAQVALFRTAVSDGKLIEINERYANMAGYPTVEDCMAEFNAADAWADLAGRAELVSILQEKGSVKNFETAIIQKDGTQKHIIFSARIFTEQGYLEGSVVDITERKQAEEALQESLKKYETLFGAFPLGITVSNNSGEIVESNKMAEKLLGLSKEEHEQRAIDGVEWKIVNVDGTPMLPEEYASVRALKENRLIGDVEMGIVKSNGEITWINVTAASIPLEKYGVVVTYFDITDRKRAEKELKKAKQAALEAQRAAEAANQAKSAFLANMSHELRSPLSAILGFARVLDRNPVMPEDKAHLAIIRRSGEHLLNLINDILDMSKIEAGRTVFSEQNVDVYRLLDDVEAMFRLHTEDKGLHLIFECDAGIPQYIRTDVIKLRQVLVNLLGNALKFTKEGGISVKIENLRKEDRQSSIVNLQFSIKDTGPGIAPDDVDSVFEAFVQSDSGRQSQEGTGLGLPISRKFVQMMGGDITVESEVGGGSVF